MNVSGQRSESSERRFERLYTQHFDRVAAFLLARADRDSAADGLARTFEIAWVPMRYSRCRALTASPAVRAVQSA
jgi:hypothetical protein